MMGAKQFFEELREGDEYLSTLMNREVSGGIGLELRERMVVITVRQKSSSFVDDDNHME